MDALEADGVVLIAMNVVAIATFTVVCWSDYFSTSAALREIRAAPSARVSDLRSLLGDADDKLVVVRGQVQAAMAGSLGLGPKLPLGALIADRSGEWSVIVQEKYTSLYDLSIFNESIVRMRSVPFALVEGGQWRSSACLDVRLDDSFHPLPLTWVYHNKCTMPKPMYSSTGARFKGGFAVQMLIEECILPIGKEITAVGICRNHDGALEIKSCMKLPYFLSDKTKDEIEAELISKSNESFWCGVVLGALLVGVVGYAGYAIIRNWRKKKQSRSRSQNQESSSEEQPQSNANEEDLEDVPKG